MKRVVLCCLLCLITPLAVFAIPDAGSRKSAKQIAIEKEMVEVAKAGEESAHALYQGGKISLSDLDAWSERRFQAELRQATTQRQRLAVLDARIAAVRNIEEQTQRAAAAGVLSVDDLKTVQFRRLELQRQREIELRP